MMTLRLNGFCGCIGCWRKVNDALSGIEGIERKLIDKKKFLVTVTGTVDTESLKAKLAKIRKSGKVEVIFQGDGEKKKEEEKKPKEETNTKQKEENPKEKSDTNQNKEMKEEAEQKEKVDKAITIPVSNDADASPSIRGENSTEPMVEQNLEHGPARSPCDYGFDYGPNVSFGNGPYDYPQGHAHGIGPYNDPPPQDHAHDNGPNNDPPPQDHAQGNGPNKDPPPQDHAQGNGPNKDPPPQEFAGEISNACSIIM